MGSSYTSVGHIRTLILLMTGLIVSLPANAQRRAKNKNITIATEEADGVVDFGGLRAPGLQRWMRSFVDQNGQLRITRIDASQAPRLDVHFSILEPDTELLTLESLDDAERLQRIQLLMATDDERTVQPFLDFDVLENESTNGPAAALLPMDKAESGLDAVIVAAGHAGYKDIPQLQSAHKSALAAVITRLNAARINVIWYGPMLYTYRAFEGIQGELSRFDESLKQCETDYQRYRLETAKERAEDAAPPTPPPCGLHAGLGSDIKRAIDRRSPRGKHSRLFGIDRETLGLKPCTEIGYTTTALRHMDLDILEDRTMDYGAFEEALRMLVRYSKAGHRRALIIVGDGRDGYLDDDSTCREFYSTRDPECSTQGKDLRGRARKEKITQCVQRKMDARATKVQERFAERASTWLALARAADVQIHVVTYAMRRADGSVLSHEWERERLELLAQKSGGTYREVVRPRDASEVAVTLGKELTEGYVLRVNAGLTSETPYKVQLKAVLKHSEGLDGGKTLSSQVVELTAPFIGEGAEYWLKEKNGWLRAEVGPIAYWGVIVLLVILLLVLFWFFFKLVKAAVMKLVGAVFKKGKKAASAAAKGTRR